MKATLTWKSSMQFESETGGHKVGLDTKQPLGQDQFMTPKELVASGLAGCTAMDVVALLKKNKQNFNAFGIDVDIVSTQGGHPLVFESAMLTFNVTGEVNRQILIDSVRLSQTKYCGVSAMLSKAFPIRYNIKLNNELIAEGQASF